MCVLTALGMNVYIYKFAYEVIITHFLTFISQHYPTHVVYNSFDEC